MFPFWMIDPSKKEGAGGANPAAACLGREHVVVIGVIAAAEAPLNQIAGAESANAPGTPCEPRAVLPACRLAQLSRAICLGAGSCECPGAPYYA